MGESVWPIRCGHCNALLFKPVRDVNRAEKHSAPLFCNKACFGLAHRDPNPPTAEQRRIAKAEYDRQRRADLGEELRAQKRAARLRLLAENPALVRQREKANRDANRDRHAEYCRTPEYREWKAQYDRQYLAKKQYGPFAEAALTLRALEEEITCRATRFEIYTERGTLNKTQRRKRDYAKAVGC